MGPFAFSVHVHHERGHPTIIDFRDYDRALGAAKDRARSPFVTGVEITCDSQIIWSDAKGVIAEPDTH